MQKKLKEFHESHAAIAIENCEVKEGPGGGRLKIVIRNSSDLEQSPSKFKISASKFTAGGDEVTLQEIPNLANFE